MTNRVFHILKTGFGVLAFVLAMTNVLGQELPKSILHHTLDNKELYFIEGNSGKLSGAIGLKEPFEDYTYSRDSSEVFAITQHYVYIIDPTEQVIKEEFQYMDVIVKEEYDERDPNSLIKRPRISIDGDVVYEYNSDLRDFWKKKFEIEEYYGKKLSEAINQEDVNAIIEEKKSKLDLITSQYAKIRESVLVYSFNIKTKIIKFLHKYEGESIGAIKDNNFVYAIEDEVVLVDLETSEVKKKPLKIPEADKKTFSSGVSIVSIIGNADLQLPYEAVAVFFENKDKTGRVKVLKINLTELKVIDRKEFGSYIEYSRSLGKVHFDVGNFHYFLDMSLPESPMPPNKSEMSEAKYNESMKDYRERTKEYMELIKRPNRNSLIISSVDKQAEVLIELNDVFIALPTNERYLFINRVYEVELFDLMKMESVWITELDF